MIALIGTIASFFVRRGVQSKYAGPLAYLSTAIAAVALLASLWGIWSMIVSRHDERHDAKQDAAILKKEVPAIQKSADQRSQDTITVQRQREELRHADSPPPSGDGLTPRQRRGCIILRQQGAHLADHPPCERLTG